MARYQLENCTQYCLQYLQRHQLQDEVLHNDYITEFMFNLNARLSQSIASVGVLDNCIGLSSAQVELSQAKKVPSIFPRAVMAFHWPRTDLDQLLNIRCIMSL